MAGPHAFPIEVFAFTYKKKKKEKDKSLHGPHSKN